MAALILASSVMSGGIRFSVLGLGRVDDTVHQLSNGSTISSARDDDSTLNSAALLNDLVRACTFRVALPRCSFPDKSLSRPLLLVRRAIERRSGLGLVDLVIHGDGANVDRSWRSMGGSGSSPRPMPSIAESDLMSASPKLLERLDRAKMRCIVLESPRDAPVVHR